MPRRIFDPAALRSAVNRAVTPAEAAVLLKHFAVWGGVPYDPEQYSWHHYAGASEDRDLVIIDRPKSADGAIYSQPGYGYFLPRCDLTVAEGGPTVRYKDDRGVIRAAYSPAEDHVRSFAELSKLAADLEANPPKKTLPVFSAKLRNVKLGDAAYLAMARRAIKVTEGARQLPSLRGAAASMVVGSRVLPPPHYLLNEACGVDGTWTLVTAGEIESDPALDRDEQYFVASDVFVGCPPKWIAKSIVVLRGGRAYLRASYLKTKTGLVDTLEWLLINLVQYSGILSHVIRVRTMLRLRAKFDDPTDEKLGDLIVANSGARSLKWMRETRPGHKLDPEAIAEAMPMCMRGPGTPGTGFHLKNEHRRQIASTLAVVAGALRVTAEDDILDLFDPLLDMYAKAHPKNKARIGELKRQIIAATRGGWSDFPCAKRKGMAHAKTGIVCPFKAGWNQPLGSNVQQCFASRGGPVEPSFTEVTPAEMLLTTGPLAITTAARPSSSTKRKRAVSTDDDSDDAALMAAADAIDDDAALVAAVEATESREPKRAREG